jgi:hypothetical protein
LGQDRGLVCKSNSKSLIVGRLKMAPFAKSASKFKASPPPGGLWVASSNFAAPSKSDD